MASRTVFFGRVWGVGVGLDRVFRTVLSRMWPAGSHVLRRLLARRRTDLGRRCRARLTGCGCELRRPGCRGGDRGQERGSTRHLAGARPITCGSIGCAALGWLRVRLRYLGARQPRATSGPWLRSGTSVGPVDGEGPWHSPPAIPDQTRRRTEGRQPLHPAGWSGCAGYVVATSTTPSR